MRSESLHSGPLSIWNKDKRCALQPLIYETERVIPKIGRLLHFLRSSYANAISITIFPFLLFFWLSFFIVTRSTPIILIFPSLQALTLLVLLLPPQQLLVLFLLFLLSSYPLTSVSSSMRRSGKYRDDVSLGTLKGILSLWPERMLKNPRN